MNEHRVASDIAARYSAGLTPGNATWGGLVYDMFVEIGPSVATSCSAVRVHDSTHSGKVSLSVYNKIKLFFVI